MVLTQPRNSLPADQYTVTLTRITGDEQFLCKNEPDSVTIRSSSDSVLLEGLEEYSVYSVTVEARNDFSGINEFFNVSDITTLSAGKNSGCI